MVNKGKGVSPVIATILMVMITVGLVAFSYTWLITVVEDSKTTQEDTTEALKKTQQLISIGTVFVNGTGTYFEVKALGINSMPIDLTGTKFYIEDIPKIDTEVINWLSPSCKLSFLAPGASCYGRITGYNNGSCAMGDTFRVAVAWGAEASKKIKGCTQI